MSVVIHKTIKMERPLVSHSSFFSPQIILLECLVNNAMFCMKIND